MTDRPSDDEIVRPFFDVPDYDWLLEQEREIRRWFLIEQSKMDFTEHVTATQMGFERRRKSSKYKKRIRRSR